MEPSVHFRKANTEPTMHFRKINTEPSMHFKKANTELLLPVYSQLSISLLSLLQVLFPTYRGQADYERYTWRGASVYCPGDTRPWRGGGHTDVHTHELP